MLQQLFWQEFSKTLRLWRRLAGFFMRALMSEVSGQSGRRSIFTIPCVASLQRARNPEQDYSGEKSLFQRFIEGILYPIQTLVEWYCCLREFFFYILWHANQTSLYKIAEVYSTYNRSKVWGPVGCNCQKFVLEVLDRLNLRFALEAFIDRINQGDYDLTIADPECLQTVFNSVLELDGFAEDHWNHLLPWSKYLLFTYNSISSE